MPTDSPVMRADDTAVSDWRVWGLDASVVVRGPDRLGSARTIVDEHLHRIELACSRFRDDSEIRTVEAAPGPSVVSPLLARLVSAALKAAEVTGGDVDPTVGAAMMRLGYDRDFAEIAGRDLPVPVTFTPAPSWRTVTLRDRTLTLPPGTRLDLGATAKAVAADDCARIVANTLGCGVLVCLGGDIATAGVAPEGDWQILVQDGDDAPACRIALPAGGAVATSSTRKRRWSRNGVGVHHIVDPRSGRPAQGDWQTVTVAANSCVDANTASTACIVRGVAGVNYLAQLGLPARLVDIDGRVRTLGGWPHHAEGAA
ncbi:FAD:protein FMN transferase [Prescottella agglutinans]|uniref:FAD:protein FMN transferase n=1 Tax=Prescottella agglutinans TaxID=1644129 RepID=A0ABT6MIL9_9NOCA|nr:FAD:protein FMN transferase [Prescottella agglutinans]MDH6283641.1 thiamine biosynthesis lipoprotein [Prescottella agglutinans]